MCDETLDFLSFFLFTSYYKEILLCLWNNIQINFYTFIVSSSIFFFFFKVVRKEPSTNVTFRDG